MLERIFSAPLKEMDGIRIVAVSGSMDVLHENLIKKGIAALQSLGLTVSFSAHGREKRVGGAADIRNRVSDLHDAFMDPGVAAILIGLGGTNAVDLLPFIDFELIRKHPKPICGFSDATVILNSIYSRTGLITYYGPMFFSFVVNTDAAYTVDYFKKALFQKTPFSLSPGVKWGNYTVLQSDMINEGYAVLREGSAEGTLVGGHIPSLNLLQGTVYWPDLENVILFIEICERYGKDTIAKLNQYLGALMLQNGADKVKGLLVGRLYKDDAVHVEELKQVLLSREDLKNIPIIINLDFGHTTPMVTLPIGGRINILKDRIVISEH